MSIGRAEEGAQDEADASASNVFSYVAGAKGVALPGTLPRFLGYEHFAYTPYGERWVAEHLNQQTTAASETTSRRLCTMKRLIFTLSLLVVGVWAYTAEMPSMVYVEGGEYTSTAWRESGRRLSRVSVSSFQIGTHEVTLDEWRAFVEATGYEFDWDQNLRNTIPGGGLPEQRAGSTAMYHISWIEAVRYCNWLSRTLGYEEVYEITEVGEEIEVRWHADRIGFRLPTEAQWEYAARGGHKPTPTIYAGSNDIDEVAWYRGNSGRQVHEVGQKQPNELGIFDLTGNVWEWCWDYYDVNYTPHGEEDPKGPARGNAPDMFEKPDWERDARVGRGCSFFGFTDWCELTFRSGAWSRDRSVIGIRVALSISGESETGLVKPQRSLVQLNPSPIDRWEFRYWDRQRLPNDL